VKRIAVSDFVIAWFIIFAFAAWTLAGCGPKCPTCPKPIAPPPTVIVKTPPPCTLPDLPDPLPQLGVPDAQRDGYFVPRQSWAMLGGYQASVRAWIVAAAGCLTAGRSAP
jgi:hypothetical protein